MFGALAMRGLGGLLLVAAALKLFGPGIEPVGQLGLFSTPEFQVALIQAEVALGLWLLSGRAPFAAWLTALLLFTVFAGVSFHQGWIGQSSCGCFGRLSVSPWYAFTLDVAVVACLICGRPQLNASRADWRSNAKAALLPVGGTVVGVAGISALLLGWANWRYGSTEAAFAYLRGDRLSVSPFLVDLGEMISGESRQVTLKITNWTEKPVRLIGGTQDCACTVVEDLPLELLPGELRDVTVQVRLTGKPGIANRKAHFLVDDNGLRQVRFFMTGRIIASEGVAAKARHTVRVVSQSVSQPGL